ncbi:MAG TPA: SIMPL domain-containing protein [Flavobacterium sp.]|jgi:uncharacterized protein YggE
MKTFFLAATIALSSFTGNAQESGNANYGNNQYSVSQSSTIQTTSSSSDEMVITIRGIYNERATAKVAVFSLLQLGQTAEEATTLIDERIRKVTAELQALGKEIEIVTDMISFVPMYEFEVNKKIFNPKTYNEKPTGFELKKNLIIRFKNSSEFDKIVAACSRQEIYDLAKVDYMSTNFDLVHDQLQTRAFEEFKQTLTNYSLIMNTDLTKKEKFIQEGFNVTYPMESYRSYEAHASADANFGVKDIVNKVRKNTTQYYNGVAAKSHTFIVNPDVTEPTIQVFYDMTVRIKLKEDQLPKNTIMKNNKYYLITPAGDIKPLIL